MNLLRGWDRIKGRFFLIPSQAPGHTMQEEIASSAVNSPPCWTLSQLKSFIQSSWMTYEFGGYFPCVKKPKQPKPNPCPPPPKKRREKILWKNKPLKNINLSWCKRFLFNVNLSVSLLHFGFGLALFYNFLFLFFKCRPVFKQTSKQKLPKWGIKIFILKVP